MNKCRLHCNRYCNSISYSVFVARSASNLVWNDGDPNGGTSENCMILTPYGVFDISCTVGPLPFICVQELSEEKYLPAGNYFYGYLLASLD